jgi:hypothetical protein
MPAQQQAARTVYYGVLDEAPDLEAILEDEDGPMDLTGATVTINIAYASHSYYYNPWKRIVTNGACVVDPDQVTNKGKVTWTPQPGDLTPAGQFGYTFRIVWGGSNRPQTVPPNTYYPLTIKTQVGGELP